MKSAVKHGNHLYRLVGRLGFRSKG